uniref:Uncharacterized protein n=1 Tax=Chromera velia CCMP2878 TaxID=1169474 RepID=A0A0G4HXL5_9ALVE|eukprot:Cvel_9287.t1-p1 / transcript=Cvel_9287.t1 / gene=Cvel_9287 / organism=Chromera_velia_CCMP2878 / gene_product=hypothetical protein / transcript_product=hypothetical protein / location=Cvel_scaffold531:47631-48437(-) / protein_length=269 / sequence_SO=supercontig / SO=protein_coding / is_pseudo=false
MRRVRTRDSLLDFAMMNNHQHGTMDQTKDAAVPGGPQNPDTEFDAKPAMALLSPGQSKEARFSPSRFVTILPVPTASIAVEKYILRGGARTNKSAVSTTTPKTPPSSEASLSPSSNPDTDEFPRQNPPVLLLSIDAKETPKIPRTPFPSMTQLSDAAKLARTPFPSVAQQLPPLTHTAKMPRTPFPSMVQLTNLSSSPLTPAPSEASPRTPTPSQASLSPFSGLCPAHALPLQMQREGAAESRLSPYQTSEASPLTPVPSIASDLDGLE